MQAFAHPHLLKFLLLDVHRLRDLFQFNRYAHLDEEQAWMMIESAGLFASQEMFPFFKSMDETPARYDGKGKVTTHPQLKKIFSIAAEQGWIGGNASFERGGLQLPEMLFSTGHLLFQAANNAVQGYLGLSGGAAGLITSFGNEKQIKTYVPPIFSGKWQGTMALTEPQAGSSLSDITSSAVPTMEGHYLIRGQKIFISGGQHGAAENFIHLTLARIKDAPAGTKGISLFIIPAFRPTADGTLEDNDVYCAGDFQKMGQRGYATTHLVFGDHNNCHGYLVGEANKGLAYMFQMMNGARISVGMCAAGIAMAAMQYSLSYAQQRPQGRKNNEKDPTQPPVMIINHADVQRMLLTQQAIVGGSLSLGMECTRLYDLCEVTTGEEKENHFLLLEILTPIMKTYASEHGIRSVTNALQILGGYGFTIDFPIQQLYRDIRIMSLYEGTTGIQSIDLLGRKVIMQEGKALKVLHNAIQETIRDAENFEELSDSCKQLKLELERIKRVMLYLQPRLLEGKLNAFLADATVFMELAGYIVIGWQWLKIGLTACRQLNHPDTSANTQDRMNFMLHTMKFYFRYELTHTAAFETTLCQSEALTELSENHWNQITKF
ncbi:MAG: acyl-CoA dehydrogenase [Sediminibacterium sp.]